MIKRVLDAEGSDGALRPLIMILKTFLVQRNLNEVFTGGLGSYSILILLSSFLNVFLILVLTSQSHPRIVSGQISPWQNMSILLIEFFELFGGKGINVHAVGVGVDIDADDGKAAGFFLKKSVLTGPRTDMKLAIQDPQDASMPRCLSNPYCACQKTMLGGDHTAYALCKASFTRPTTVLPLSLAAITNCRNL